jgi:hypothetical protein
MVGTLDTTKAMLHLENNKCYEKESMTEGNSPCKSLENITRRKDEMRTKLVQVWLDSRKEPTQCRRALKLTDRFYEDDSTTKSRTRVATSTISKSMDLDMDFNYSDLIWAEADFIEYAKLSVGTDSESYFSLFANFTRQEEKEVNNACKHIFGEIVAESKHFGAHLGSVDRSFMMLLYKLQTDDQRLRPAFMKMPTRFRVDDTIPLFFRLLVDFVGKAYSTSFLEVLDHIIAATAPEESASEEEETSADDAKKEVQFFFGYAIACIVGITEKEESLDGPMAAIVNGMWTTHNEIFRNTEHVKRCYPDIVQLKNRGKQRTKKTDQDKPLKSDERIGLTLVAEPYFDFGLALMMEIRKEFDQTTIKRLGIRCVEKAYENLQLNESLYQQFLICVGDRQVATLDEPDDLFHMYTKLISKTFNARAGAETHKFKEDNTSRYAQNAVDTALREGLKVAAKRKPKIQNKSKSATPA